jgi:N-dimethylarginine dimethylaminohydrolase
VADPLRQVTRGWPAAPARTYLMGPPDYFTVEYAINPWMNPDVPLDAALAMRQWQRLRDTYRRLGHTVRVIDPQPGLDTALCVLDADTAAYYPAAFDDAGRAALTSHFAELIEAKDEDAEVLALNAVSDGRHVVLPEHAAGLAAQVAEKASSPCRSTCQNSAKPGAVPSAAPWN